MSDLGGAFINIATDPRLVPSPGRPYTSDNRLTDALLLIEDPIKNPTQQGVIWFPPGVYFITTGRVIGANITLSFAPGALLVPVVPEEHGLPVIEDSAIQIQGMIDAEPREIFATASTFSSDFNVVGNITSVNIGRIVFTGRSIQNVFPEWWGASRIGPGAEPGIDTAAIRAAINAAIVDREAFTDATLPPITLYLGGTYVINDEVSVGSASCVVIEGCGAPGSAPTIRLMLATGFDAPPRAMFRFERISSVLLRGLSFDGAGIVSQCIQVDFSLRRDQVDHLFVMERCSWINGRQAQVTFDDDSSVAPVRGSILVKIQQCHFGGLERRFVPLIPLTSTARTAHVALTFRAAYSAKLSVVGSVFLGFSLRAIRAEGGKVDLFGCSFDIDEYPDSPFSVATDLELTRASVPEPRFSSLNAMGCVSRSPSFLRVVPGIVQGEASPTAANVILSGVMHRWRRGVLFSYVPPTVIWEESSSALIQQSPLSGARLSLIGCMFDFMGNPVVFGGGDVGFDVLFQLPVSRVYTNRLLPHISNAATFGYLDWPFSFMTFTPDDVATINTITTLGARSEAPFPFSLPDSSRLFGAFGPFAWATWLWA